MIIKKSGFLSFLSTFMLLCSIHFWGLYYSLSEILYDIIDFSFYSAFFLFIFTAIQKPNNFTIPTNYWLFSWPIFYFYFFLIMSTLSCWYFHNQFPALTALAMRFFVFLLLYYALMLSGIEKEKIIKLMLIFSGVYMFVFTLQLIVFPNAIVPLGRTTEFDRGFLRLRLEGVGFVTMTGFYLLNKYLNEKKLKLLFGYGLCLFFVFILGFRTLLATYLFSSVLLVLLVNKISVKSLYMLLPVLGLVAIASQLEFVQAFFDESAAASEQQLAAGDEYIRFRTFNFLFNIVNENWVTLIFGNGQPFVGTSYGNYVWLYGAEKMGYIAADLGLVGFVFNYGLISCILFINIFRLGIQQKLGKDSLYLKVFFIYLIISSFTTSEIYRAGMFGPVCVALYLINISSYSVKLASLNKKKSWQTR